ncbi:hypothetical protein IP86_08980 [Rhodopseudomonas sp. AAP120]|nr:hypothetical protein IP86_08980 [Rhodopseudomonas sp. AAP120]
MRFAIDERVAGVAEQNEVCGAAALFFAQPFVVSWSASAFRLNMADIRNQRSVRVDEDGRATRVGA